MKKNHVKYGKPIKILNFFFKTGCKLNFSRKSSKELHLSTHTLSIGYIHISKSSNLIFSTELQKIDLVYNVSL